MSSPELRLAGLTMRELRIPLTVSFRHASAERAESSSVWVEATGPNLSRGCGEGCPRSYVTGETIDSALSFLEAYRESILHEVTSLASLRAWVSAERSAIDANPAAWCAIELAVLHLLGLGRQATVERLLDLPALAGVFRYTAVLGDAEPAAFHALARRYFTQGFRDFKVKLSGDTDRDWSKLDVFKDQPPDGIRVRADANNLWTSADQAMEGLAALRFPWFAVEEPIGRGQYADLARIADGLGARIVLDESLLRAEELQRLDGPPARWIANVRVSKMGGLLRTLDVIRAAVDLGISLVVGAQVGETSLLTRAGLTAAQAAGTALVAQEGAFGTHLLSRDVCDPPLMFGYGGELRSDDVAWLRSPGLGLVAIYGPF